MRFTDHDSSDPIDVWAAEEGRDSSPGSPSVTTTVANTMILRIGAFDDDEVKTIDVTELSTDEDITMDESGSGNGTCSGGAGYVQQAAIGASGTADFSLTATEQWRTLTIAIAPLTLTGMVSGGAGYVGQPSTGSSGTETFSLTASEQARMITIAIAPIDPCCCGDLLQP